MSALILRRATVLACAIDANGNIADANVRVIGNCAVVAYTRLVQKGTTTVSSQETRVLQRGAGGWQRGRTRRDALASFFA